MSERLLLDHEAVWLSYARWSMTDRALRPVTLRPYLSVGLPFLLSVSFPKISFPYLNTKAKMNQFRLIKTPLSDGLPRGLNKLLQLRQSGDHTSSREAKTRNFASLLFSKFAFSYVLFR
jgi:hypothetical protein